MHMNDTDTQAFGRLAPGKPLADAQRQLEDDGYLLVEGLCDCKFVAHLLEVSRDRSGKVGSVKTQKIGIGSGRFRRGRAAIARRWDIPISPVEFGVDEHALPWWPPIASVLGEDAEHSFSGVVYPTRSPAQCWHIDSPHVSADHLPAHALNVMIAPTHATGHGPHRDCERLSPANQSSSEPGSGER